MWFLSDLARLKAERESIATLLESAEWLSGVEWRLEASRLVVDAILLINEKEWPVCMTYPAFFPAAPITVRPQSGERWSGHQYNDGTLCLQWGPDNWRPEVTGAQMLQSTQVLLATENRPEAERREAPSRHYLTPGQTLRSEYTRVHVGREVYDRLTAETPPAWISFTRHRQAESQLLVIQSVHDESGLWTNPDVPKTLRHEAGSPWLQRANVRRVPMDDIGGIATTEDLDALLKAHHRAGAFEPFPTEEDHVAGIVIVDANSTLRVFHRYGSDPALFEAAMIGPPEANGAPRLSPEYGALAEKSIGIVGLGSVGSKLAISLARSGVGSFVLVDEDIFLPENVVRNALDLLNVGEHKTDAVAAAVERVSPQVSVKTDCIHLTGQESNAALNKTLSRLRGCDVVIDATADARVFNLLSALSAAGRPLVWMEVFGGGIGGLVARSRPGQDPSPPMVRGAYLQYTSENPSSEVMPSRPYEAESADGDVSTASDADVSFIAAMATQIALDILLEQSGDFPMVHARFNRTLGGASTAREWPEESQRSV